MLGDVLQPESWAGGLAGCTHLVILTSAVPKMRPTRNPDDPPEWYYEPGEEVRRLCCFDWLAARQRLGRAGGRWGHASPPPLASPRPVHPSI